MRCLILFWLHTALLTIALAIWAIMDIISEVAK